MKKPEGGGSSPPGTTLRFGPGGAGSTPAGTIIRILHKMVIKLDKQEICDRLRRSYDLETIVYNKENCFDCPALYVCPVGSRARVKLKK